MRQVNNQRRINKIYNVKTAPEKHSEKAGVQAGHKIMLLPHRADCEACYF